MNKKIAKEKSYLFFLPLSKAVLWENVHPFSLILSATYENSYIAKVCPLLGLCFTENFQVHALMHFVPVWLSQALHIVGTPLRLELKYTCQTTLWWLPFFSAEIKHLLSKATGTVLWTKAGIQSQISRIVYPFFLSCRIENLQQGAGDPSEFLEWQKQMRGKDLEEQMTEIECRRLQGKLSYEEAVLAHQNVTQENKKKADFLREEVIHTGMVKFCWLPICANHSTDDTYY